MSSWRNPPTAHVVEVLNRARSQPAKDGLWPEELVLSPDDYDLFLRDLPATARFVSTDDPRTHVLAGLFSTKFVRGAA